MDLYIGVKQVHQDRSITPATHSLTENGNSVRSLETLTISKDHVMTFWIHLGSLALTIRYIGAVLDPSGYTTLSRQVDDQHTLKNIVQKVANSKQTLRFSFMD
jgi:hypothetical protein